MIMPSIYLPVPFYTAHTPPPGPAPSHPTLPPRPHTTRYARNAPTPTCRTAFPACQPPLPYYTLPWIITTLPSPTTTTFPAYPLPHTFHYLAPVSYLLPAPALMTFTRRAPILTRRAFTAVPHHLTPHLPSGRFWPVTPAARSPPARLTGATIRLWLRVPVRYLPLPADAIYRFTAAACRWRSC